MRVVALAIVALFLSGCNGDAAYERLGGAFTAQRTAADLDDFQATVRPYSDDVAIRESFPEQFIIHGLDANDCIELSELLRAKPYIATLGPCESEG